MEIGKEKKTLYLIISAILLLILLVFQYGCVRRSLDPYINKDLGVREGVKMALLPFDNLSETQGAGKKMESFILVEFLKYSPIKIVEPGEVSVALSEERVRLATSIPKETIRKLGRKLGVDFFVIGIVHDYTTKTASGASGSGKVPTVAITLRIIKAETGNIVWAINVTKRGTDSETVFGIGRINSVDRLAQKTAMESAMAFAASLKE